MRGRFLSQRKESVDFGHRSGGLMPSLISSLKSIINAFLHGQLVLNLPQETEFLDFPLDNR